VAQASAGPPGGEPRVSTGNAGLDAMLDGGLVARRPYLIVGPSGTGKTTLALQFLCAGIRNGERALLVTLEEPPNEVRANHRGLAPELGKVDVFDAIPDVMRYERAPFKDIAAVRSATPFERVSEEIRRTPELTSIEVTITALEQMLRTEVQRHAYSRIVIDSLTALQYFCMKGFDIVAGAQTFLRYLSDLRVTTILTVEAPLEDVETPERMLARGEIRLFRWELDDVTVRAVGVEKFRGSSHDLRLHPYRIGPTGLDINLAVTISRDTRQILQGTAPLAPGEIPSGPVEPIPSTLDVLNAELRDLALVGADTGRIRTELEAALASARSGDSEHATERLLRAVAIGATLPDHLSAATTHPDGEIARALHRLVARAESSRVGEPPVRVPEPPILTARLAKILSDLKPATGPEPTVPMLFSASGPAPMGGAPTVTPAPTPSAPPGTPTPQPPATPVPTAPTVPPNRAEAVSTPVVTPRAAATTSHAARASPPPLPQALRLPEATRGANKPPSPGAPSRPRHLPTGSRPTPTPTPSVSAPVPSMTVSAETSTAAMTPEAPAPKKRKRSTTGARKKAIPGPPKEPTVLPTPGSSPPTPVAPTSPPPVPAVPAAATASPTEAAPSVGPPADTGFPPPSEVSPTSRPKRRVVRKKKAPSVVGATAGPPPEDASAAPAPAPPPESPPTERPPETP